VTNERVRALTPAPPRPGARYVLYQASRNRRVDANEALAHAAAWANQLRLPLLYHETFDEPNPRRRAFIRAGVEETARRLAGLGVGYRFGGDVETAEAAVVVIDDYPYGVQAPDPTVLCEAVDASCVVPMRRFDKREYAAYTIRPKIRRVLDQFLKPYPALSVDVRWTAPLPPVAGGPPPGGRLEAEKRLEHFLENNLRRYARERNDPTARATSGLSPYLHFGQISAREVALAARTHAEEHHLIADEFLEELIVRRELSFNFACHASGPDWYDALPDWARKTLDAHASDPREYVYSLDEFDAARTHDQLWNACQRELRLKGVIHGYYRMYWGKKVLEWSANAREAVRVMVELHHRWALDGGDPNTYVGILWTLGLHDRPWAERPVFGMIRYMSLDGMRRKTGVDAYIRAIGELEAQPCLWQ
jgi:deoxyribodipyrimidine photo-lyase